MTETYEEFRKKMDELTKRMKKADEEWEAIINPSIRPVQSIIDVLVSICEINLDEITEDELIILKIIDKVLSWILGRLQQRHFNFNCGLEFVILIFPERVERLTTISNEYISECFSAAFERKAKEAQLRRKKGPPWERKEPTPLEYAKHRWESCPLYGNVVVGGKESVSKTAGNLFSRLSYVKYSYPVYQMVRRDEQIALTAVRYILCWIISEAEGNDATEIVRNIESQLGIKNISASFLSTGGGVL